MSQPHSEHNVEQLHLSAAVLVMRLILLLFLLDMGFSLLLLGFLALNNYPDWHHHYFTLLFAVQIVKYIALTTITVQLVSRWASRNIFISGHHLVISDGITHKKEKVYELQQLRTVEIQQSWLGQRLNYGNILLTFAASGFKQDITLVEMNHPRSCAKEIEKYLGEVESHV